MNKPIKKIILILIIVLILPVLFLSVYEVTSLNRDEEILEEIYNSQLESILFSVNQYSDDIVRSWALRIESILEINSKPDELKSNLIKFFRESQSVKSIYLSDSLFSQQLYLKYDKGEVIFEKENGNLKKVVEVNRRILDRLFRYRESDFLKIEPIYSGSKEELHLLFVLSEEKFCLMSVDKRSLIETTISSKIQSVARDQFLVSISDSLSGEEIYQTSPIETGRQLVRKNLWLIPGYQIGIQPKEQTVADLVEKRSSSNLIIFFVFALMMIITAYFAYRNIKKEIELAQIRTDFVSNVSHELRTPLALISMFAETLEMGRVKTEEKKNEYYKIISNETGRLSSIVNKILSFSQIEAGKRNYHFKEVCLNQLLQSVADSYSFHLLNKGFKFNYDQTDEKLFINADEEAVSEAVINLIDNAVKYSGDSKVILLRLNRRNENAVVEVEDKGIGIPKEEQKKIFDKFYRASRGLVHNTKGTGLGLSLTKHIVDAHKGIIEVESEPGKGSIFRLLFPLK